MTGKELLDYLRSETLKDNVAPYLWSDDTLFLYLNEAQREFARRTYCLLDDSTYSITTTVPTSGVGVPQYTLDANIIYVFNAIIDGNTWRLGNYTNRFIPSFLTTSIGQPQVFTTDHNAETIRFYPVPDGNGAGTGGAYVVNLQVARLPTTTISSSVNPEIASQYHLDLCEYVGWRCTRGPDADGQRLVTSKEYKDEWDKRVLEAKREYYRYRSGNNATAVQNYTGIRRP